MPYSQGIKLEDGRDVVEHSPLIQSLVQTSEQALIFIPEGVRDECEPFPSEESSVHNSSNASVLRAQTVTLAPAFAKNLAVAAPIPLLAPHTSACFPLRAVLE